MPGLLRRTCGDYARVLCLISHARLRVQLAPGIPCALCLSRDTVLQTSGVSRRGNAKLWLCLRIESRLADGGCRGFCSLPLCGGGSGRGAASGPPVWTPLPNPLRAGCARLAPQGERELTAVAGTSMLHFRWIALEPVIGLAEGETPWRYDGDFEFKNSKPPKIIAFP